MALSSCDNSDKAKNILTVTAEPYRFLVEAVAGDAWQVRTIVPKGGNPETFDPTPRDMLSMSGSRAYFMVGGLGFENMWKKDIMEIHSSIKIVDTSMGISRSDSDPHLWTSPDNMSVIARNVCDVLCNLDNVNAVAYRNRLNTFNLMLQRTDSIIHKQLQLCEHKSFLIYHPTLTYFANRYGLEQIVIEHEGKEASISHLRSVIDEAKAKGVKKVLVQAEFDIENSKVIAEEIGADVYAIDPLNYDWQGQMLHIANILSQKNDIQ